MESRATQRTGVNKWLSNLVKGLERAAVQPALDKRAELLATKVNQVRLASTASVTCSLTCFIGSRHQILQSARYKPCT